MGSHIDLLYTRGNGVQALLSLACLTTLRNIEASFSVQAAQAQQPLYSLHNRKNLGQGRSSNQLDHGMISGMNNTAFKSIQTTS